MFLNELNHKISDLPFKFSLHILEQALCIPLTLDETNCERSIADLASDFSLTLEEIEPRVRSLIEANRIFEAGISISCPHVLIDISHGQDANALRNNTNAIRMSVESFSRLEDNKEKETIIIGGGMEKDRYCAALFLIECGFKNVTTSDRVETSEL